MARLRYWFNFTADMAIRVGTFAIAAHAALGIMNAFEWSIAGILMGALIYITYAMYLWRAMNAEHAITLLERSIGMRVRLKNYRSLQVRIDHTLFTPWLQALAKEVKRQMREAA